MSEESRDETSEAVSAWSQETLDEAVAEIMRLGVFGSALIEARPVWQLPYKILIGQIRETNEHGTFRWVISGEVPIDHVDSAVAATPREVTRHFALKWQLDAARYQDPSVQQALGENQKQSWGQLGAILIQKSEALLALADDESLWRESGDR